MNTLILAGLATPILAGCIFVSDRPYSSPPPPLPPSSTTVSIGAGYGWPHVRHVVWTEYYSCSEEEVYYLENCGYDDDDLLVLCFYARRARLPIRYVVYEYDRCGRNLYAVGLALRLDPSWYYCREIPPGYSCPPPYGRVYAYHWNRQHHYLSNDECHALIQLQIGIRYYGYSHTAYFEEHHRSRLRAEPHPFRTIVVRDYRKAGLGNRSCEETVIVKKERPWDAPTPHDWDQRRAAEREKARAVYAAKEREHEQDVKARAAERHEAAEIARRQVQEMKSRREEDDRRNPHHDDKKFAIPDRKPGPSDDRGRPADRGGEHPRRIQPDDPGRTDLPRGSDDFKSGRSDGRGKPDEDGRRTPGPDPRRIEEPRKPPPDPKRTEEPRRIPPRESRESEEPKRTPPPPKKSEEPRRTPPPESRRSEEPKRTPPPPPRRAEEPPKRSPPPPPKKAEDPPKRNPPSEGKKEERKRR